MSKACKKESNIQITVVSSMLSPMILVNDVAKTYFDLKPDWNCGSLHLWFTSEFEWPKPFPRSLRQKAY